MSYCVNCGVELETSIKKCPLCNTPVINPNEYPKNSLPSMEEAPFPDKVGSVEPINRKDFAIVLSVIFGCTALSCLLLNYLVWNPNRWSLLVLGFCGLMWMIFVPPLLIRNIRKRVMALIVSMMTGVYIYLIGVFADSTDWVIELGLPITFAVLVLVEIFLTVGKIKRSFPVLASLIFMEAAALCIVIELLVDYALRQPLELRWSAIVLTVCTIITVALISMFSRRRMRNEIKRRFHL